MKNMRKMFGVLLAVALAFAVAVPAFAATSSPYLFGDGLPDNTNPNEVSTYIVTEPVADASVDVMFIMEAGNEVWSGSGAFRVEFPFTVSGNGTDTLTVYDLLDQINTTSSSLSFTLGKDPTKPHPTGYLSTVTHGGTTWDNGQLGFDGWVFRVNDLFPVKGVNVDNVIKYQGTLIDETYIEDGDVIHFFYDLPSDLDSSSGSIAAEYVRINPHTLNITGNSVTAQLQSHNTYIQPVSPYDMYVNKYVNLSGIDVEIYNANGVLITTEETDSNGEVTFTSLTAGDYTIRTASSLRWNIPGNLGWLADGAYFEYTSAYKVITIPAP